MNATCPDCDNAGRIFRLCDDQGHSVGWIVLESEPEGNELIALGALAVARCRFTECTPDEAADFAQGLINNGL
jgi:hypothetical protein